MLVWLDSVANHPARMISARGPVRDNGRMADSNDGATTQSSDDGRRGANGRHRPEEPQQPADGSGELERPTTPDTHARPESKPRYTRTAGTWAAVVVATITLIVLLVFILQNLQPATVTFLWMRGNLPVGVALLLAAAIGGLLVALVGAARILQLRRTAARDRKQEHSHTS